MDNEKLYSPLEFYLHDRRAEEANGEYGYVDLYDDRYKIPHDEAFEHMDAIELAIRRDRDRMDRTCGLAEYVPESLDDIVTSLFPNIEMHGGKLWCVADITLSRPITPGEMGELAQWWSGQLSDGWGEGFEQHEVKVGREDLYIVPWSPDEEFRIYTAREFTKHLGFEIPAGEREVENSAAVCLNGTLSPGDLVISIPSHDYSCLVGTVLSISEVGTPEHYGLSDKPTIHVNFKDTDYSQQRLHEAQDMLGDLYGRPTAPGTWPPVDVEDVAMTPDDLIRITGIGREELLEILDSGERAAAFCNCILAGLGMTEQSVAVPDLKPLIQQFHERLGENLAVLLPIISADNGTLPDSEDTKRIGAVMNAHWFLKEYQGWDASDLEYLLQFENPLEMFADHLPGTLNGTIDLYGVMFADGGILDKRDAHQKGYALMGEPAAPTADALKQELFDRLDANMTDYRSKMLDASREDIFDMAEDIAVRFRACDFMKTAYDYKTGEVEFLLKFQDPLSLITDSLSAVPGEIVDMSDVLSSIIEDRSSHGHYAKVMDADNPAAKESARATVDREKPSVLERIREAAKMPKEPRKDKPARDRLGPEL